MLSGVNCEKMLERAKQDYNNTEKQKTCFGKYYTFLLLKV